MRGQAKAGDTESRGRHRIGAKGVLDRPSRRLVHMHAVGKEAVERSARRHDPTPAHPEFSLQGVAPWTGDRVAGAVAVADLQHMDGARNAQPSLFEQLEIGGERLGPAQRLDAWNAGRTARGHPNRNRGRHTGKTHEPRPLAEANCWGPDPTGKIVAAMSRELAT